MFNVNVKFACKKIHSFEVRPDTVVKVNHTSGYLCMYNKPYSSILITLVIIQALLSNKARTEFVDY